MTSPEASAHAVVDLLLVSYNTRDELRACLASLETTFGSALYRRIGVRVLDNASTDGSAGMVARDFDRVQLVRSDRNIFYGPGVNELVAASSAEYVVLLNPDTVIDTDVISPMVRALEGGERVALAFPALVGADGRRQACCQEFPTLSSELAVLLADKPLARPLRRWWDAEAVVQRRFAPPTARTFEMRFVWSTCVMMRRSDAEAYGPFDSGFPMYDTDLDLCRRLAGAGRTATYLSDISVIHTGGASSTTEQRRRMTETGRRAYYRRHGTRAEAILFPALQLLHRAVRLRHLQRSPAVTLGDHVHD